jgi:hypothetical protein
VVTEAGSHLRLKDSCITQLTAQGPSRTCTESKAEEEAETLRPESYTTPGPRRTNPWPQQDDIIGIESQFKTCWQRSLLHSMVLTGNDKAPPLDQAGPPAGRADIGEVGREVGVAEARPPCALHTDP